MNFPARIFALFAAVQISLVAAIAGDAPPAGEKPADSLQGVWQPVQGELGGRVMPAAALTSISLTIQGTNYDVFAATENSHDFGYTKIDAAATPKAIDVISTNGPNMGKTFPSIYEFDGDRLRICYDLSGKKRPTEFKSTPGTLQLLFTYERKRQ